MNTWLALAVEDHVHHERALGYWREEATSTLAFCRVTALGFVRLLTNATAMAGRALPVSAAWRAYATYRSLPDVMLAPEPDGCEALLAVWAGSAGAAPRLWTDAYLAAFARAAGMRLVTFDADFERFEGVELLRLRAGG